MKDKIYDPARSNQQAPAEGMAAVDTHMPEEDAIEEAIDQQLEDRGRANIEEYESRPGAEQERQSGD